MPYASSSIPFSVGFPIPYFVIMNSAEQYNTDDLTIFKNVTKCSLGVPLAFLDIWFCLESQINAHIQFLYAASRYLTFSSARKKKLSLPSSIWVQDYHTMKHRNRIPSKGFIIVARVFILGLQPKILSEYYLGLEEWGWIWEVV